MPACENEGCDKEGSSLCTGCRISYFCGADCQRSAWKAHKKDCKKAKERRLLLTDEEEGQLTPAFAEALAAMHARFDEDGDGVLSKDEIQQLAAACNGAPFDEEEIDQIWEFHEVKAGCSPSRKTTSDTMISTKTEEDKEDDKGGVVAVAPGAEEGVEGLTCNGFQDLFQNQAASRPEDVWGDLVCLGYELGSLEFSEERFAANRKDRQQ